MRNTMKSVNGYKVYRVHDYNGNEFLKLKDGDEILAYAEERTIDDYEWEKEDNEMFCKVGVLTTTKGNQFIWWCDRETEEDYLTKVKSAE